MSGALEDRTVRWDTDPDGRRWRIVRCACCGKEGRHGARGLIMTCHAHHRRRGTLHRFPRSKAVIMQSSDLQCSHVSADGVRCPKPRERCPRTGKFRNNVCAMHRERRRFGNHMDAPVRTWQRDGDTQCAHVYPNGSRCTGKRGRRKCGRFRTPYCIMHANRRFQGLDMDAPKHMPGQRDRMIYG